MTLAQVIEDIVTSLMLNAYVTSANPVHVNRITGVMNKANVDYGAVEEALRDEIRDLVGESSDTASSDDISSMLTEGQAAGLVRSGYGKLQNPATIVDEGIKYLPYATIAGLALSMAPIIFEYITRPGSPLDLRFKRFMENEFNAFMDRQTQRNTQIGTRQVIVQSRAGFIQANGVGNENTLRQIREGGTDGNRLAEISFTDHSRGLF